MRAWRDDGERSARRLECTRLATIDAPVVCRRAAHVLALQCLAGNNATAGWIANGAPTLSRQTKIVTPDEVSTFISNGDWHGAAWALSKLDEAAIRDRVGKMSGEHRQNVVEGARHGATWQGAIIRIVDEIDHRNAVIGSVKFFAWKRDWQHTGNYMTALNDDDIRRVATRITLNFSDLKAIADADPGTPKQYRLGIAFFSVRGFIDKLPRDVVGPDADKQVLVWLAADDVVRPYAAAKWAPGAKPKIRLIKAGNWGDTYAKYVAGRIDPESGTVMSLQDAKVQAVKVDGFTLDVTDEIHLRAGNHNPGTLIHEAIHAIAPGGIRDDLGSAVNEGVAEYFARRVARSAAKHASPSYPTQYAGVVPLAQLVGDRALAEAFFGGVTLKLKFEVDDKTKAGTFDAWSRAMNDPDQRASAPAIFSSNK